MPKPDTHKTAPQARSTKGDCCTDLQCESGLKNHYFEGKRLTPDSFRVEQRYLVERRRLLNRAIHGWGVVYGYGLESLPSKEGGQGATRRQLTTQPGLALDSCGRELLQVDTLLVDVQRVIVLDDKGNPIKREDRQAAFSAVAYAKRKGRDSPPACWVLSVHYAEQDTDSIRVIDTCRCERDEWNHACETVRYSLQIIPCEDCCKGPECGLKCECRSGGCCGQENTAEAGRGQVEVPKAEASKAGLPHPRGGCRCLCEHLTGLNPGDSCTGRLCEIDEPCGRVRVDLEHGVSLACVQVVDDGCKGWTFGADIEACGPRRLVKRNDLLFDLIRGCDLTRISKIGWKEWHRRDRDNPVEFTDFLKAFAPADPTESRKDEYVSDLFWVEFSGPVRKDTLRADCFVMTIIGTEREGAWWQTLRVPIVGVETSSEDGDPVGQVRRATIIVDGAWLDDAVRGTVTLFQAGETRVEIEVRGDFIVDCNGQTVDANAVGLSAAPTGNGAPGGPFLSSFCVGPAPSPARRSARPEPSDRKGA